MVFLGFLLVLSCILCSDSTCSKGLSTPSLELYKDFDEVALLQKTLAVHRRANSAIDLDQTWHERPSPIAGCEGFDCIKQYVNLPDPSYHWKDTGYRIRGTGSTYERVLDKTKLSAPRVDWTGYVLNMTSQTWLHQQDEVNFPVWWHTLIVIVPANRDLNDWATLQLDFGIESLNKSGRLLRLENRDSADGEQQLEADAGSPTIVIDEHNLGTNLGSLTAAAQKAAYLAVKTRSVAASLLNIPNGYEVLADDPAKLWRASDTLRGYTYTNFLHHPDHPEILHELPVAKAIVRAMDTITAFSNTLPHSETLVRFAVTGNSKLGTATLVAAALDDRVRVIVPGGTGLWVIPTSFHAASTLDQLHVDRNAMAAHLYNVSVHAHGKSWPDVYMSAMFAGLLEDPNAMKMHNIIDPSAWMSRLTKPTLYQAGSSDEVLGARFLDDLRVRLPQIPAPTRTNYVPNALHADGLWKGLPSAAAFIMGHFQEKAIPEVSETYSPSDMSFEVHQVSSHTPIAVQRWLSFDEACREAIVDPTKDQSDDVCPVWHGSKLEETSPGSGTWRAVTEPEQQSKILGIYVTLTYEWPEPGSNFTISSSMQNTTAKSIWPDKLTKRLWDGELIKPH